MGGGSGKISGVWVAVVDTGRWQWLMRGVVDESLVDMRGGVG